MADAQHASFTSTDPEVSEALEGSVRPALLDCPVHAIIER